MLHLFTQKLRFIHNIDVLSLQMTQRRSQYVVVEAVIFECKLTFHLPKSLSEAQYMRIMDFLSVTRKWPDSKLDTILDNEFEIHRICIHSNSLPSILSLNSTE